MRKVISILALAVGCLNIQAQDKKFFDNVNFEIKSLYGWKQHNMTPMSLDAQLSYQFSNRWSILASAEASRLLFDGGSGNNWYINSTLLGGGLAYTLFLDSEQRFDLRLQTLITVGHTDWKHTTFDVGTMWYGKSQERGIAPLIGLGVRYEKSHSSGIRDWIGLYGTIGIRF